jgi:hypothetical protein
VVITWLWFDKTASITSNVEVEGIDENRTKLGFSPVTRRLRSLKTYQALASGKTTGIGPDLVGIMGGWSY